MSIRTLEKTYPYQQERAGNKKPRGYIKKPDLKTEVVNFAFLASMDFDKFFDLVTDDLKDLDRGAATDADTNFPASEPIKERVSSSNFDNLTINISHALNNPKYLGRTVKGLAKELGTNADIIRRALHYGQRLSETVMIHPRKNQHGELIFVPKARFYKEASYLDVILSFLKKH